MAKEYIERKAALNELKEELEMNTPMYTEEQNRCIDLGLKIAIKDIKRLPASDVVEVVRCKNCEYYRQNEYSPDEDMMCMCWCDWLPTDPDDFCSSGRRRTN